MNDEKYIGLDVHQATISAAVMDQTGKIIMECIVETKAATILELFAGLRGTLAVTFEEGTSAAWLYALLRPHVARVVVCNPRKNALLKQGNKNDSIDARKLAELLRGNYLKSVYHGENGVRTLRELARSYLTTSKDLTRVMSRLKAVYRSWAIPCAGKRRLLQAPAQAVAGKDPASRGTPARRTSLRGIGPAETIATTSAARTIDREPAAYDHRQIKTDPFCGSDSLGLAGGLDPNASSFSYQATVVGLQRTGTGDAHQRGILLCRRPTAALQEAGFDPWAEQRS